MSICKFNLPEGMCVSVRLSVVPSQNVQGVRGDRRALKGQAFMLVMLIRDKYALRHSNRIHLVVTVQPNCNWSGVLWGACGEGADGADYNSGDGRCDNPVW